MGAVWMLIASTEQATALAPALTPETVLAVWTDPTLLRLGLSFSLPALVILLCHEAGHLWACHRHRLPATLPYFLPLPLGLGTLGAFIRIRTPIRDKRVLFDVGVAGPLAGFAALLPFLVLGIARSRVVPLSTLADLAPGYLLVPGKSLAILGLARLVHGPMPAESVLALHPFAMAAWLGLLATALNLIPLGQLDGGHILYAVFGRAQSRLAVPIWLALLAAVYVWWGWAVWVVVTLIMGLRHPPVRDETAPLSPGRRCLALLSLAIFVLSFMPIPIREVAILSVG